MTQNLMKSLEQDINSEIELINREIRNSVYIKYDIINEYFDQLYNLNNTICNKSINFRNEINELISNIIKKLQNKSP